MKKLEEEILAILRKVYTVPSEEAEVLRAKELVELSLRSLDEFAEFILVNRIGKSFLKSTGA